MRGIRRSLSYFCGSAILFGVLDVDSVGAEIRRTVWDGVFTAEQAARGKAIFAGTCAGCHGADLNAANRPALRGEGFLNHWMEDSLDALLTRVKSMPTSGTKL